jgi:AhpD family alkylhydroperoxidase
METALSTGSVPASPGIPAEAASNEPAASPRLAPIRRALHPMVALANAIYRFGVGTTAPVAVIFARAPRLIFAHLVLMMTSEAGVSLDKRTRALARVFGSKTNGCMFCNDLTTRLALKHRALGQEDVDALADWRASDRFTERERAMLAYLEELNVTRRTSDENFAALKRQFDEREIVEITWLNAVENYLNLQARPLGLAPESCEIPRRGA